MKKIYKAFFAAGLFLSLSTLTSSQKDAERGDDSDSPIPTVSMMPVSVTLPSSNLQESRDGSDSDSETVIDMGGASLVNDSPPLPTIVTATTVTTQPTPPQQAPVDLNEDVPGCLDNYLRYVVCFSIVSKGWLGLAWKATGGASVFILGVASLGKLDEDLRIKMGIAGSVLGGISAFCKTLKDFAKDNIKERRADLRQVIRDAHNQG